MTRSEELLNKLRPFLAGDRHRLFSEVEETLNEVHDFLLTFTEAATATPQAATLPQPRHYRVRVTLEEEYTAENEEDAWDLAMEAIASRRGMKLVDDNITEIK